jgi:4-coumarate--CoA ligase
MVPPLIVFLGKHPLVSEYNLSSLRQIWCSAAPLSREVQETANRRLGKDIIRQAYGMTEITLAVVLNPVSGNKFGSSGLLVPGMMCKVSHTIALFQ